MLNLGLALLKKTCTALKSWINADKITCTVLKPWINTDKITYTVLKHSTLNTEQCCIFGGPNAALCEALLYIVFEGVSITSKDIDHQSKQYRSSADDQISRVKMNYIAGCKFKGCTGVSSPLHF